MSPRRFLGGVAAAAAATGVLSALKFQSVDAPTLIITGTHEGKCKGSESIAPFELGTLAPRGLAGDELGYCSIGEESFAGLGARLGVLIPNARRATTVPPCRGVP